MAIDFGPLLGGITQGLMLGTELRQTGEDRRQKRLQLEREFTLKSFDALSDLDDPDLFDQVKSQLTAIAPSQAVKDELAKVAFPESRRKRIKVARAASVLDQLIKAHGAGKVFGEMLPATVTVDGQEVTVRRLLDLAEFPVPKATVKEPVTEEIGVPISTEDFALRHFGPKRTEQIQVGERAVVKEFLPAPPKRLVLAQFDSKFSRTPWANVPAPLTKDGDPDSAAVMRYYDEARKQGFPGFSDPLTAAKDATARFDKERSFIGGELSRLHTIMTNAKSTEAMVRGAADAWNRLINRKDFLRYGFTVVALDVPTVTAQWRQQNKKTGGGGVTIGVPLPEGGRPEGGALDVRPIRDKRGAITHYLINGERFTVKESRTEARRRVVEENDENLARRLGTSQAQINQWRQTTPAAKERETLERQLREVEDKMRLAGRQLKETTTTGERAKLTATLRDLTNQRARLRERLARLGVASPGPARSTGAPQEEDDPLGIR